MTRRDKRRQLVGWLSELFRGKESAASYRKILVEPLETRQLMAVDGFSALLGSNRMGDVSSDIDSRLGGVSALSGEGEGSGAEGEAANDLVAFAKALADSGTRFFGAAWCPFCNEQKQLFQDGYKFLPFVEVTNPDRTPNAVATEEGITQYPTWEFPDGSRLTGVQTLATLSQRSGVAIPQSSSPTVADLANVSVGVGSPLHIPIDAYDPNGNPLTITVTSSNPSVLQASVLSGNRSLRLSTQGFGDMVFELFEDRAPVPTGRIIELAEDGFYDGLKFHRVVNNFVIQGGDPLGNGTGGSTLGDFDDQFNLDLQHNRTGVLSFAKSTDDTNDSQFFITEGPQRFLDFNHSVFGQLVEGEVVREAISNTAVTGSTPVNNVVINTATIFDDTENGVVMLKPTGTGTGTATITVTVTDTEGNSTQKTFTATVTADNANGAPFLNPVPTVQASSNTPATVTLTSQDAEGDAVTYSVQKIGSLDYTVTVNSTTGLVTVTPPQNYVGQLQFKAIVQQTTTPTTTSTTDEQVVTVNVASGTQSAPSGLDLLATSDLGASSTDNLTSASTLVFTVNGTQTGAFVEVRAGNTVVGSATATGGTTQVTVSNVAALAEGSILFTSRQTLNGVTSADSPSLSVTLDRTVPASIASGTIPQNASVGQALSVNLAQAEEGQGLVYAISNGPTGLAINAQTGVISWTPTSTQIGAQTFTLSLTDAAGNMTNQTVSITVVESPQAELRLNVVDMNGSPITTIAAGQNFKVQLIAADLRAVSSRTGVFAAYADLLFDSAIIEPIANSPISHIAPYNGTPVSGTVASGLIDEVGSYSSSLQQVGADPRVFAEVTFVAKATGDARLRIEAADATGTAVLLYDEQNAISDDRVLYGASEFAVGANFQLVNDVYNFDEDSGVKSLTVLANDTTTGGAVLTITSVGTRSGGGNVTIASDGRSLNYTSASNFNGAETFTYTVQNGTGISRTATVTVQVADVNDPPIALADSFNVFRNSTENVLQVLLNDTTGVDAASAETLRVTAVGTGSAGGSISVGSSGLTIRYSPKANFQGTETFTYTLSDGRGGTATGTVSVAVETENPPPTPLNDAFTVTEDAAEASFDVLANDTTSDPNETLSISAVGSSSNGSSLRIGTDGRTVLYRPGTNFAGTEVLSYTLRDSGGATAVGSITFTVTGVNDAPNAVDDTVTALSGNATTTFNVLANDTNVDTGETLTITAVTQPPSGSGTLAISTDRRSLIYTPPSSTFQGNFTATYTLSDGSLTDTATVSATVNSYVNRKVAGVVQLDGLLGDAYGFNLSLTGTDITGTAVSRSAATTSAGAFEFGNLAPGTFTLEREPLPFLNDSGETIQINSGANDGDFTANLQVSAALLPQYIGIRDFIGSSRQNSLTVALNGDGTTEWVARNGAWSSFSTLNITANNNFNALTVSGVNGSSQNLTASVPVTGARAQVVGQESSMRLLRVYGSPTDVGLTTSTSTASTASSTASTNNALEGEGEAPVSGVQSPSVAAIGSSVVDTGVVDQAVAELAPPVGLSYFVGSNMAARTGGNAAGVDLSSEAVDAAMSSVRPSMELRLAEDLEDVLASEVSGS